MLQRLLKKNGIIIGHTSVKLPECTCPAPESSAPRHSRPCTPQLPVMTRAPSEKACFAGTGDHQIAGTKEASSPIAWVTSASSLLASSGKNSSGPALIQQHPWGGGSAVRRYGAPDFRSNWRTGATGNQRPRGIRVGRAASLWECATWHG
jgi:hypothetical protein